MDKLGKQQKDELATALAILALYDGEVSTFACYGEMEAHCYTVPYVRTSLKLYFQ